MSPRASTGAPCRCSGGMYGGVPTVCRTSTLASDALNGTLPASTSCSRARPKSRIFAPPSGDSITLAGFRSRWMTPSECAWTNALESWRAMSTTCMGVGGPCRMRAASVAPRTYSMTMCTPSSDSSTSYTAAMWGWFSRAAARASRSIFRRSSEASDPAVPERVFRATRRCRRVSSASHTSPFAPAPRRSRMRYGPTLARAIVGQVLEGRRSLTQSTQGSAAGVRRRSTISPWLLD